ncbi:hypothetical protein [Streptomyces lunaelactis]|uniref:hypothetical protein n=1 Tax=Streptomyces lunaelactis TaxID=1535768 RepID=UPI00158514E7|nr:hypothetical protein [Streptomyces lunaelactis]NUL09053.1 hypothetical protein [Streptomyces lunaelactis]
MPTVHLSKDDITAMTVDEDGNVTIEITDEALDKLPRKRRMAPSAMEIAMQPPARPGDRDDGFATGYAVGLRAARRPRY